MRKAFAEAIINRGDRTNTYILSGDLGFMALEGVKAAFGKRFINSGVAEQNMIGVAAGLARDGNRVFVYSIAPFCYARPYEQIRNDLALPSLSVCLVGNGGGFAYGLMGPTHHALEDCAAISALGLKILVPVFNQDIDALLFLYADRPRYLRLGVEEKIENFEAPQYSPWRVLMEGNSGVMVALGPLAGLAFRALSKLPYSNRPNLWAVSEFDIGSIPEQFFSQVSDSFLYVIEEHVVEGGLGMNISYSLLKRGVPIKGFIHRSALRYPSGKFGSQSFHRKECQLDQGSILELVVSKSCD